MTNPRRRGFLRCAILALAAAPVSAALLANRPTAVSAASVQDGTALHSPLPAPPEDGRSDAEEDQSAAPELLTPKQINRIRYMELRGMRLRTDRPDAVVVKIPRETIEQFLEALRGNPEFPNHKKTRREFMRLTGPQKLHQIAVRQGAEWADRVEIKSDPEVFKTFKKKIMPVVLRSCGTAGCHTSTNDEAVGFRLFKDPKRSVATTYTNFISLDKVEVRVAGEEGEEPQHMIDRSSPKNSLLLSYMLPRGDVRAELQHPGDVEYKPAFTSRGSTVYKNMLRWIQSLKHPTAGYQLDDDEDEKDDGEDAEEKPKDDPGDRRARKDDKAGGGG